MKTKGWAVSAGRETPLEKTHPKTRSILFMILPTDSAAIARPANRAHSSRPPIINSYFSGAGLMDLGLSLGGAEIQQSFELDPGCCATLRANFRHEIIEGDIQDKFVRNEKQCDAMVATYPCTKYSTIADIHGGPRAAYRQIGNGVSVPVGEWLRREFVRYFRSA